MSKVNAAASDHNAVLQTIQASRAAQAAGHTLESDQLLAQVAQRAPGHPAVLNELGVRMLSRGDMQKASELFRRATQAEPGSAALWSNLAGALHELGRFDEEMEAIERALLLEPRHTSSLLQKGLLMELRGDSRNAARVFRNALATIPKAATVPASMAAAVTHAREAISKDDEALHGLLEDRLASIRTTHGEATQHRANHSVQLLTGQRKRYDSQPTFMFFPGLPTIEFFDGAEFPWLEGLEAAADDIRAELTSVMVSDREGLEPYIAYSDGLPLDQWKDLNKSRRWSAYFLYNQGEPQDAHLARCPRTAEALSQVPQVDVARRGPTAFFSILDARTHIPPHTGVTNTRLTVHLPLIVPPGCSFRVGSETREWVPGKAWVFDDTIEHEAWNNSDVPRAVLIFDIWNHHLNAAERDIVRAAIETVGTYYGAQDVGPR